MMSVALILVGFLPGLILGLCLGVSSTRCTCEETTHD